MLTKKFIKIAIVFIVSIPAVFANYDSPDQDNKSQAFLSKAITSLAKKIDAPSYSPSYDFPRPTGQYAVGLTRYHMIDRNRLDPYEPSLFRELMVQAWYPTSQKAIGAKAPYLPDIMPHMKKEAQKAYYIPESVLNYLVVDVKCHALEDTPLVQATQKFPVIILCHGLSSMASLHTAHAENLASHGYVVFGINHTFACSLASFPDGRMYPFRFDWKSTDKGSQFNKIVRIWQDDVRFVLDQIEVLSAQKFDSSNNANMFYNKLDLKKIGIFGHSMGGATSAQTCRHDARVKAAINMDGPLFGDDYDAGFKKPYMVLIAESSLKRTVTRMTDQELLEHVITREEEEFINTVFNHGNINLCGNIRQLGEQAYYVYFKGGGHNTFTDMPLVKDISKLLHVLEYFGLKAGTIAPLRAIEITNRLIVDFFNKHLLSKPALILESNAPSPFKEIIISR